MVKATCAIALVLGLGMAADAFGANTTGPITAESLLAEMDDLAALAEWPDPPFTCKQFSSYDRTAESPDQGPLWFAPMDFGRYVRREMRNGRQESVMMDAEGPGCIVRIWSANPEGILRIYLDGNERPALEQDMAAALDGAHAPFVAPFGHLLAHGYNLYFPLPYAKRCKVTTTGGNIYYHVDYRTYPAGTAVKSFTMDELAGLTDEIAEIGRRLADPYAATARPGNAATREIGGDALAPGAAKVLAALKGPAAIFELSVTPNATGGDLRRLLRHTLLQLTFDGESSASVLCPLGDFFGSGPDVNPFATLPLAMTTSGQLCSKWFMPFEKSCMIEAVNCGADAVSFKAAVTTVPYRWTERSMHFHAKWRAEKHMATRPFRDWTFVRCAGAGVYVGNMLSVANPVEEWWGEGDEKIYVDGEKFPGWFGTGTEDYYGYGWCETELFSHAYHSLTRCDGPSHHGFTSVNRIHVLDRIPFTKQFRFDFEVWHCKPRTTVSYSATSYWYARPGGTDFFAPPTPELLAVEEPPPLANPRSVKGALEAEKFKVLRKSGSVEVLLDVELWSRQKQLCWTGGKPGDVLVLAFPVKAAGRYRVFANFTCADGYGIVQLFLNDQKAGEPMDFYHKGATTTGRRELGVFELKPGDNLLQAEITGRNPRAAPNFSFGLDYLFLEKAE